MEKVYILGDYQQSSVDSNQLDFLCFRLIIATFGPLKSYNENKQQKHL